MEYLVEVRLTNLLLMCLLIVGCGEEIQRKVEQEKAKDDPTVPLLIACEACKEKVAKKSKQ